MQLDDLWPAESKMGGDQSGAQLRWGKRQGPKWHFYDPHIDFGMSATKIIMPSKMEVASQHCDTVPNKTKEIFTL